MGRGKFTLFAIVAAFAVPHFALPLVARADLPITQIAVTGTPAPDGGTFTSFEAPTADRQTNYNTGYTPFYFEATNSNGVSGVYYYTFNTSGQLVTTGTVADTTTTAATGGTFASFTSLSSGYGELGFIGTDSFGTQGVYAIGSFPLTLIATTNTTPVSGVTFGNFQNISIMGFADYGQVGGEIESSSGIYDFDNYGSGNSLEFELVANFSTTPPGASGPFTSFGPMSFKAGQLSSLAAGIQGEIWAVRATAGGVEGIYYEIESINGGLDTPATLVSLVNTGTAIPGNTGHFTSFGDPVATSNEITFTGHYITASGDQQGIFAYGPYQDFGTPMNPEIPTLSELVATGQVAPSTGGATFTGFPELADDSFDQIFLVHRPL